MVLPLAGDSTIASFGGSAFFLIPRTIVDVGT